MAKKSEIRIHKKTLKIIEVQVNNDTKVAMKFIYFNLLRSRGLSTVHKPNK